MTKIYDIIHIDNNAIVVDKKIEIMTGNLYWNKKDNQIETAFVDLKSKEKFFIIASTIKIPNSDVPLIRLKEDVETLCKEYNKKYNFPNLAAEAKTHIHWKQGYKAVQAKYTEEDLRKAIELARELSGMEATIKVMTGEKLEIDDFQYTKDELIQSLQPKYKQVELECNQSELLGEVYNGTGIAGKMYSDKLVLKIENDYVQVIKLIL